MKIDRSKRKSQASVTKKPHPGLYGWLSTLFDVFFGIVSFFVYKRVVISNNTIPGKGPVLILAKHCSIADIPLGKYTVGKEGGRHLWCLMKGEMARGPLSPIYLRVGGIPVDRSNPERSKQDLLFARKVLHDGNTLCIFPEQTYYPSKMGRGRTPGFRFIAGKPEEPIGIVCVGFRYIKRRFRRTLVEVHIGPLRQYTKDDDPEIFLDARMRDIAELSGLDYPYPQPSGRTVSKPAAAT